MLSKERKNEFERMTSQILFDNDMYKIPVNLLKIAQNCGITVYNTNFEKLGKSNVSGAIRYVDGKFSILLNQNDSKEKKRYTLAHEIGHFFMDNEALKTSKIHVDSLYENCDDSSCIESRNENLSNIKLTSKQEIDYFAGALLMNQTILKKFFEVETSIPTLAKMFGVSCSAMTVRLDMLGLI